MSPGRDGAPAAAATGTSTNALTQRDEPNGPAAEGEGRVHVRASRVFPELEASS
jgi:hypothetical protein